MGGGELGEREKDRDSPPSSEPQGIDRSEGKQSLEKRPDRAPKGAAGRPGVHKLSVEGKGVRLHERAARPAGDYPKWGDGTPRATGKEASPGETGRRNRGKGSQGGCGGKPERGGRARPGLPAGCLSPGGAPGVRVGGGEQQGCPRSSSRSSWARGMPPGRGQRRDADSKSVSCFRLQMGLYRG